MRLAWARSARFLTPSRRLLREGALPRPGALLKCCAAGSKRESEHLRGIFAHLALSGLSAESAESFYVRFWWQPVECAHVPTVVDSRNAGQRASARAFDGKWSRRAQEC